MGKTIAEGLIETGMKKGMKKGMEKGQMKEAVEARQRILLGLLDERFGALPPKVRTTIESSTNVETLDTWLRRFAKADTLEEVGIQ